MRKRSKSKAIIDKVDRALQDWFRKMYPNEKCESCGGLFYCMHHHLPKSRSNAGRYDHDNLIFICKKCHDEISFNGGSQVVARYSIAKGIEWIKKMAELAKVRRPSYSKKELDFIIEKYKI